MGGFDAARRLLATIGARWALAILALVAGTDAALAQSCALSPADQQRLRAEHLFGGAPTPGPVVVRRGYVMQYDAAHRVPRWVNWRATSDFIANFPRSGWRESFRDDPDLAAPVHDGDYDGLLKRFDYARGHMTPWFISGGDRDGDNQRVRDGNQSLSDPFDACTVMELNYMSNVAPQLQRLFNGGNGVWYRIETLERTRILPRGTGLHILTGTIFGPNPQRVGPANDIAVPDMFYRILVTDDGAVPFLFVHRRPRGSKGCPLPAEPEACIVTIADIERVAGTDFFNALSDAEERRIETSDGLAIWRRLIGPPPPARRPRRP
jgi:endonuclease G, mitochondrial